MKKFVNLVKNESLKLWGQRSFRVLLIIFAVILSLTPVFNLLFTSDYSDMISSGKTHEDYKAQAEAARAEGEELEAYECDVYYEVELYFAEQGLAQSSVEYSLYYVGLRDLSLARSSLELMGSGKYTPEELKLSYYSTLDEFYMFLIDYGFYDDMGANGYLQYNVLDVVKTALEDKSALEWIKIIDSELESLRFDIENFSMKSYYDQLKSYVSESVEYYTTERDVVLEVIKNTSLPESERSYYNAMLDYYSDVLACYDGYDRGVDYLIANDCEYLSWEFNSVDQILYNAVYSCEDSYPMSAEEFASNPYRFSYDGVEDYNDEMKNDRLVALEAQEYVHYSLENSIPLSSMLSSGSTKATTIDQFRSFAGMLAVLFICYAGVMMAHEYTGGTIRLLLIKPRSRAKILWSKLVCMAFWWVVVAACSLILLTVENIVLLGVNDLFVPDLKATRNGIVEIPSVIAAIGVFGEEFVIAMLYVVFATFFAVLTKKVALSIVLPMLVSLGATMIQDVCMSLYNYSGATFLAYTPFFYLDFSFLHFIAPDNFVMSYYYFTEVSSKIILGKHANLWIGIALIAGLTALIALWAQRAFKKQKI